MIVKSWKVPCAPFAECFFLSVTGATLLVAPGTALAQNVAGAAMAAPQDVGAKVTDIIVTAQKREQRLQDVPVAVTALGSATLDQIKFHAVEDLTGVSPGLSVRPGQGGAQIPAFTMRGIYGFNTIGADQGVALYIDGVYVNSAVGANFDLADIERIEVLRGPQGTLFGRNSIGGAISVITRNPSGKFDFKQQLTYGNYGQFESKTRVDLPRLGPIAASLTYLHNERRGDMQNLGAGTKTGRLVY
jgi:iron complex outermembrane recepter protein